MYDLIFCLSVIIGILLGVAGGFHAAFIFAEHRLDDDGGGEDISPARARLLSHVKTSQTKGTQKIGGSTEEPPKKSFLDRFKKGGILKKRIQDRNYDSFSGFDCQFTGESEEEMISRVIKEQNRGYHYIEKGMKK